MNTPLLKLHIIRDDNLEIDKNNENAQAKITERVRQSMAACEQNEDDVAVNNKDKI